MAQILAYALSDGGTDWNTWHFRRVADGVDLPVVLKFSKFWPVSWARDSSGVFYSRYPAEGGRERRAGRTRRRCGPARRVFPHARPAAVGRPARLSGDRSSDARAVGVVTEDGRLSHSSVCSTATRPMACWCRTSASPTRNHSRCFMAWDALYNFLGSKGDELYFQTTNGAPRGRVIAVDARNPAPAAWRTVVPHSDLTINNAAYVGGRMVVEYSRDARSLVRLFEVNGTAAGEVTLPGLGTATGFQGSGTNPEIVLHVFGLSVADARAAPRRREERSQRFPHAEGAREFRRRTSPSRCSIRARTARELPMFITRRKDATRDGNQPVMLYGYGGFNVTMSPSFSPAIQAWLELGGIYVVANLRGGGEYGEEWHQAGTKVEEAERVRRFHRGRRIPGAREIHQPETARDHRPQQRRPAGRRRAHAASGAVRRRAARCRRARHAAVSHRQRERAPVVERLRSRG